MKKYFLLFLIGITLVSCSNDDDNSTSDTSFRIIGSWNWIVSSGGIGGWTLTPESTGNTQRLIITSTTIKHYINNELVSESPYTIEVRESLIYSGDEREMIISGEDAIRNIVRISGNKLFLTGDCNDCFGSEYYRENGLAF